MVRTEAGDSEGFEVRVELRQGSVLSPLLFVLVMEAVTREIQEGLSPLVPLYADDLVLMAHNVDELRDKIRKWKEAMEKKGMKVNVGKTKVMFGGERRVKEEFVARPKWPCAMCGKGVGANSVKCTKCQLWVHGKCIGVQKSSSTVKDTFVSK